MLPFEISWLYCSITRVAVVVIVVAVAAAAALVNAAATQLHWYKLRTKYYQKNMFS